MGYPDKITCGMTVRIPDDTHAKILKCDKMGDSLGDVITRIVNYYIEDALEKSKK